MSNDSKGTDHETANSPNAASTVGSGIPKELNTRSKILHKNYDSVEREPFLAFIPQLVGWSAAS